MLLVEVNIEGHGWTPFALHGCDLQCAMQRTEEVMTKRELRDTRIRRLRSEEEIAEVKEQMESFWA